MQGLRGAPPRHRRRSHGSLHGNGASTVISSTQMDTISTAITHRNHLDTQSELKKYGIDLPDRPALSSAVTKSQPATSTRRTHPWSFSPTSFFKISAPPAISSPVKYASTSTWTTSSSETSKSPPYAGAGGDTKVLTSGYFPPSHTLKKKKKKSAVCEDPVYSPTKQASRSASRLMNVTTSEEFDTIPDNPSLLVRKDLSVVDETSYPANKFGSAFADEPTTDRKSPRIQSAPVQRRPVSARPASARPGSRISTSRPQTASQRCATSLGHHTSPTTVTTNHHSQELLDLSPYDIRNMASFPSRPTSAASRLYRSSQSVSKNLDKYHMEQIILRRVKFIIDTDDAEKEHLNLVDILEHGNVPLEYIHRYFPAKKFHSTHDIRQAMLESIKRNVRRRIKKKRDEYYGTGQNNTATSRQGSAGVHAQAQAHTQTQTQAPLSSFSEETLRQMKGALSKELAAKFQEVDDDDVVDDPEDEETLQTDGHLSAAAVRGHQDVESHTEMAETFSLIDARRNGPLERSASKESVATSASASSASVSLPSDGHHDYHSRRQDRDDSENGDDDDDQNDEGEGDGDDAKSSRSLASAASSLDVRYLRHTPVVPAPTSLRLENVTDGDHYFHPPNPFASYIATHEEPEFAGDDEYLNWRQRVTSRPSSALGYTHPSAIASNHRHLVETEQQPLNGSVTATATSSVGPHHTPVEPIPQYPEYIPETIPQYKPIRPVSGLRKRLTASSSSTRPTTAPVHRKPTVNEFLSAGSHNSPGAAAGGDDIFNDLDNTKLSVNGTDVWGLEENFDADIVQEFPSRWEAYQTATLAQMRSSSADLTASERRERHYRAILHSPGGPGCMTVLPLRPSTASSMLSEPPSQRGTGAATRPSTAATTTTTTTPARKRATLHLDTVGGVPALSHHKRYARLAQQHQELQQLTHTTTRSGVVVVSPTLVVTTPPEVLEILDHMAGVNSPSCPRPASAVPLDERKRRSRLAERAAAVIARSVMRSQNCNSTMMTSVGNGAHGACASQVASSSSRAGPGAIAAWAGAVATRAASAHPSLARPRPGTATVTATGSHQLREASARARSARLRPQSAPAPRLSSSQARPGATTTTTSDTERGVSGLNTDIVIEQWMEAKVRNIVKKKIKKRQSSVDRRRKERKTLLFLKKIGVHIPSDCEDDSEEDDHQWHGHGQNSDQGNDHDHHSVALHRPLSARQLATELVKKSHYPLVSRPKSGKQPAHQPAPHLELRQEDVDAIEKMHADTEDEEKRKEFEALVSNVRLPSETEGQNEQQHPLSDQKMEPIFDRQKRFQETYRQVLENNNAPEESTPHPSSSSKR